MTKITVTLVLQIKATEINDMAKVSIKTERYASKIIIDWQQLW